MKAGVDRVGTAETVSAHDLEVRLGVNSDTKISLPMPTSRSYGVLFCLPFFPCMYNCGAIILMKGIEAL